MGDSIRAGIIKLVLQLPPLLGGDERGTIIKRVITALVKHRRDYPNIHGRHVIPADDDSVALDDALFAIEVHRLAIALTYLTMRVVGQDAAARDLGMVGVIRVALLEALPVLQQEHDAAEARFERPPAITAATLFDAILALIKPAVIAARKNARDDGTAPSKDSPLLRNNRGPLWFVYPQPPSKAPRGGFGLMPQYEDEGALHAQLLPAGVRGDDGYGSGDDGLGGGGGDTAGDDDGDGFGSGARGPWRGAAGDDDGDGW